jgi:carboxypeptidase family protein/TonB-dependent receptor-like protein
MRIPTGLGRPAFACLMALLLTTLLSLGALAQIQNGQVSGDITDQSGAAIANAKVTIKNQATDLTFTAASNQQGHFNANQVPVGVYRVTVEAQGFKSESHTNVQVNAGSIAHADYKLQVGAVSEVVEVTGAPPTVNTEDSKLGQVVGSTQVANLPLNGRNVYDLIQMAPGAVNARGVMFEAGASTVVNGLRQDFNGYLINGVSNKGLSGAINNVPIQDTVQEFQELTLNNSAQYGNSAGSITNLVTKSGTNAWHGSGWDFWRNDKLDANNFFLNQTGDKKPPLHFNQFGGTLGGPIFKDKLFFFISYQGERFKTSAPPQTITVETPQFRSAVISAFPNSTAALLYKTFPFGGGLTNCVTLDQYLSNETSSFGLTSLAAYSDPASYSGTSLSAAQITALTSKFATLAAAAPGSTPFQCDSTAVFGAQAQTLGNLIHGNEASGRIDYTPSEKNRFFIQYNWLRSTDQFGPCTPSCSRGFTNPQRNIYPNGQFTWDHTFSARVVNEFRAGYTENNQLIDAGQPGVPFIGFDDGSVGFGSYSGYPQFFKEHQYSYGDMLSISKGSHNIKAGVDIKRNLENSVFNVARPSYYFFDPLFFAADAPYVQVSGVDPGFVSGSPAQLASNFRHWRNTEYGAYVQDDWKVSKRLTLNLGVRYDLFTRHTELNNQQTTFLPGPGTTLLDNITTGAGQIRDANKPAGGPGCNTPDQIARNVLAGVCGAGGFAASSTLGKGDHNNFGPRLGFAYDVFGDGKTALRGGVGVSYESTLYNPLSNSRWNPPFYSFDEADGALLGASGVVVYGPTTCTAAGCASSGATPTFTGAPTNPGQGVGAQAVGNLTGWFAGNPNFANLTGIVFPQGIRDPYVYNYYLSLQREIMPKLSLEMDYVGTTAHKLFHAENVNRVPGGHLPVGGCVTDTFGRTLCGHEGNVLNPNYGTLRVWENNVNSDYNALQVALKKQTSHGLMFNVNYTWSHSIDNGSTWHSGATSANGRVDGYSSDWTVPGIDRGNSTFDIRHRLVFNYVWDLPFGKHTGFMNAIVGGWQLNGIWALQTGAHFTPFDGASPNLSNAAGDPCTAADVNSGNCHNSGGDFNLDGTGGSNGRNDRPNSSIPGFSSATHNMWANGWHGQFGKPGAAGSIFSAPCLACDGNLGRNTFVGPGQWYADMSLFKNFKVTERVGLQFRFEGFNVFNHTNFLLAATAAGGAGPHNRIDQANFGKAAATLNSRNLQLGAKISF